MNSYMILRRLVLEMVRGISSNTLALQKQLVFEHTISIILDEAFTRSSTRNVRDQIVALDPDRIRPAGKTDRVYAPRVTPDEFKKMIEKKFNTEVDVIEPGKEGSKSSKFPTFKFEVNGKDESIVLAKGIIAGEEGEKKQEAAINDIIKAKGTITLEVIDSKGNPYKIHNIDSFIKLSGNTKADFAFMSKGRPVFFLQHKSPKHQQMSGTTKFTPGDYPDLKTFISSVSKEVENSEKRRLEKPMYGKIGDEELKVKAVYGNQDMTPDGVQAYVVGDLSLRGENNVEKLAADRIYYYPEVPKGVDEPVLGATFRTDRNQYGIPNVRFGIYPASYFKGLKS